MKTPVDQRPRVVGPDGRVLTRENLPSPNTRRWNAFRKAEIVAAVNGGLITIEEACARYRLTVDELAGWQRLAHRHGLRGLRVTRIQSYRA